MRKSILRLVCLVGLLCPSVVPSQAAQRIDAATASCRGCSITLTKVATLGSINDDVLPALSLGTSPVTNSQGEFYVPGFGLDQVVLYNRAGKLLRTIGRKVRVPTLI